MHTSSCPSCKREDVIFVDEANMCPIKQKILTKRALVKAGLPKEKFDEEINKLNDKDNAILKTKYQKLEKSLIKKFKNENRSKKSPKEDLSDSDSEKTEDMITEIHEVERKITFMMSEIAKAKVIIEQYDRKLTRRLERKRRAKMEFLRASQAQQFESPLEERKINDAESLEINESLQSEFKESDLIPESPTINKFPSQGGFRLIDIIKTVQSIEEQKMNEDENDSHLSPEPINEHDNVGIKSACSVADSYIADYNQENERISTFKRGPISENQDERILGSRGNIEMLLKLTNKGIFTSISYNSVCLTYI